MAREKGQEVNSAYGEPWKPKEAGEAIEGYYLGYTKVPSPRKGQGPFKSYNIKTEAGDFIGVSGAMIGSKLVRVPPGSYVWITFNGMIETNNGQAKDYSLVVEKGIKLLDPPVKNDIENTDDDGIDF